MDKAAFLDFVIEIVRRIDHEPGFKVLPRRWVVEGTFGWLVRWRRLVRDYEQRLDVSEAMIHVAMGSLLLRRISHLIYSQTDSKQWQQVSQSPARLEVTCLSSAFLPARWDVWRSLLRRAGPLAIGLRTAKRLD